MKTYAEPSQTRIHFVRHGEVYNPRQILYARMPRYRLNKRGLEESKLAAEFFKNHNIDMIYHSPMLRARQTARFIAAHHKDVQMKESSLLNEIYTPYEGKPLVELEAIRWDIYSDIDSQYEQPDDILKRIKRFAQRVIREHLGREIVAITHGDIVVLVQIWGRALDPTYENIRGLKPYPVTGSVSSLTFVGNESQPRFSYHQPGSE